MGKWDIKEDLTPSDISPFSLPPSPQKNCLTCLENWSKILKKNNFLTSPAPLPPPLKSEILLVTRIPEGLPGTHVCEADYILVLHNLLLLTSALTVVHFTREWSGTEGGTLSSLEAAWHQEKYNQTGQHYARLDWQNICFPIWMFGRRQEGRQSKEWLAQGEPQAGTHLKMQGQRTSHKLTHFHQQPPCFSATSEIVPASWTRNPLPTMVEKTLIVRSKQPRPF